VSVSEAELFAQAREARARAHAPYSKFSVGAALACADGTIVTAANVENASYGLSMCAERSAIFAAVATGRTTFTAIAIAGPDGVTVPPCGACRQVLVEFAPQLRVSYQAGASFVTTTLDVLLPATFVLP
jgi:cytidine deaminase